MTESTPLRPIESVWDYPRPPRLEPSDRRVRVVVDGTTIADTCRAVRVLETSHPPGWYIPPEDVRMDLLQPTPLHTACEYKGQASYFRISAGVQIGSMQPGRMPGRWPATRPSLASSPSTQEGSTRPGSMTNVSCPRRATSTAAGSPPT